MFDVLITNYKDIIFNTARIFSSVFEIVLAYILVNNFYRPKIKSKPMRIVPFFLLAAAVIMLQEYGYLGDSKYLAEGAVLLIYLFLLYEGNLYSKLIGAIVFSLMVAVSEIFTALISALIESSVEGVDGNSTFMRLMSFTLSNGMMIVIAVFISVFARKRENRSVSFRLWIMLLSVPLITLITFSVYQYYIEKYPEDNTLLNYIYLSCVGLFFINVLVFALFARLQSQLSVKRSNDILTSQINLQQASIKRLENSYNRTRALRHDIKNHILLLNMLSEQENYAELKSYLKELSGIIDESSYVRISGISAVDAILNEKMYEAQSKSITTNFDVVNLEKSGVKPIDICIILSNAFDNAIEANEKIEDKDKRYIKLKIHGNETFSVISLSNPSSELPKKEASRLFATSKPDADNHGFGLKSIESTVQKYSGELLCKCEDGVFTLVIRLNTTPAVSAAKKSEG